MLRELLQESSVAEILREEAEAKGEARGLAEGEVKGQRILVQTILESRFGPLDTAEVAALGAASPTVLGTLGVHITTDSRELVRVRLGLA